MHFWRTNHKMIMTDIFLLYCILISSQPEILLCSVMNFCSKDNKHRNPYLIFLVNHISDLSAVRSPMVPWNWDQPWFRLAFPLSFPRFYNSRGEFHKVWCLLNIILRELKCDKCSLLHCNRTFTVSRPGGQTHFSSGATCIQACSQVSWSSKIITYK